MRPEQIYLKQIEKQGSVKSHLQKKQQLYASDINLAIYMDLPDVQKLHVFDVVQINNKQDFLVNFYGFRMGLNHHMNERLYKLFIREMDPLIRQDNGRKYFVIVFDSLSDSKGCFDDFRDMYKRLPAFYFAKLNKIFHVEPGFLTKTFALVHFTSWSRMFFRHVEYVETVENIQQVNELKIFNVLAKCPKQITRGIKLPQQTHQMIKSAFVGTIRPKPFDYLKKEFKDYQIDPVRKVPLILSILIETMKQKRDFCLIQGIFRVAASIQDEQQLLKQIKDFKTFRLLDCQTHCKRSIAGLMKKIFTQSITPLIPYTIYNYILNQKVDQTNILYLWKLILKELPDLNRIILCYVTNFLRDFIIVNKEQNKMSAHNLAVVFNPCFFRAKESCLADLMNSGKFAAFFKWWLQHYDQVVGNNSISKEQQQDEDYYFVLQRHKKNIEKIHYKGSKHNGLEQLSD